MVTSVPAGTVTARLPIRDIRLPDFEQGLAADLGLASLLVGHDALRGREDKRTVAIANRIDLAAALVEAATRL